MTGVSDGALVPVATTLVTARNAVGIVNVGLATIFVCLSAQSNICLSFADFTKGQINIRWSNIKTKLIIGAAAAKAGPDHRVTDGRCSNGRYV